MTGRPLGAAGIVNVNSFRADDWPQRAIYTVKAASTWMMASCSDRRAPVMRSELSLTSSTSGGAGSGSTLDYSTYMVLHFRGRQDFHQCFAA
ncbi:hypothetical protein PC116_g23230 [Phytophthora cactorum]|uniref:Uncharacterized protein n=1 Tax=Phytophthora cactorum TaxID=29920 RepID=A0A8T1JYI9_9STRA|nr:hypothetical protein Pcac1_g845 [Phytophthora cactorum]KAG2896432.1 hypothetical protein PC114_g15073 [Phytophthora cactorum]KAG2905702.1 hypothetical protein PC117_g20688 [Phytophthora cactorum]KAG2984436.1 hypothetical protein PC119_g20408 [Phytophthora cactorum]KAG3012158.1 hypothetical protein PC120_g14032 [Phytophthora cactorum]